MANSSIGQMFGAGDTSTFLGLPACPDVSNLAAQIAVLGVPCATPYASVGPYCAEAPDAIRKAIAGYAGRTHHIDFDLAGPLFPSDDISVCDLGNLPFGPDNAKANRDLIRSTISAILDKSAVPILIGGDDSIPIPMIQAFADRGRYTIVQVDAHIDWREEVDGERWGLSSTMRRASEMDHIEAIIQVGQRASGSARVGDHADAVEWGARFISARDVHANGVAGIADQIPEDTEVIIAFDYDALDPAIMPGVIGRAPGGLTYWHAVDLMHAIAARNRIAAFDFVEFMPEADVDNIGALTAARLIVNAIGLAARQIETRA